MKLRWLILFFLFVAIGFGGVTVLHVSNNKPSEAPTLVESELDSGADFSRYLFESKSWQKY
jgi:hypothetical protein